HENRVREDVVMSKRPSPAAKPRSSPELRAQQIAELPHKLRTPLDVILGYCALLLEDMQTQEFDDYAEQLSKIQQAGTTLVGTVAELEDMLARERRMRLASERIQQWTLEVGFLEREEELVAGAKALVGDLVGADTMELWVTPGFDGEEPEAEEEDVDEELARWLDKTSDGVKVSLHEKDRRALLPLCTTEGALCLLMIWRDEPLSSDEQSILLQLAEAMSIVLLESKRFRYLSQRVEVDELTGVHNRHFLASTGDALMTSTLQMGAPFTVVMMDIDHFKDINDTFGHPMGDEVLRCVARCCHAELRATDAAVRYGGEEFLVLLPGANVEAGKNVAERLAHRLRELTFGEGNEGLRVTASFGVAGLMPPADRTLEELITAADQALYRAKNAGRDCVKVAGR
ncbi:MAG: diguanylate cyclase, partial [Myxococcota bacterium]